MTDKTTKNFIAACTAIKKDLFDCRVIGVEENCDGGFMFEIYDGWAVIGRVNITDDDVSIKLPWWRDSENVLSYEMVDEDDMRDIILSVFEGF